MASLECRYGHEQLEQLRLFSLVRVVFLALENFPNEQDPGSDRGRRRGLDVRQKRPAYPRNASFLDHVLEVAREGRARDAEHPCGPALVVSRLVVNELHVSGDGTGH